MRCRLGRDSGRASSRACAHFRTARQGKRAWEGGMGRACRGGKGTYAVWRFGCIPDGLSLGSLKAAARWGGSLMPEQATRRASRQRCLGPHCPLGALPCPALPCQPGSPPPAHRPLRAQLVHVDLEVDRAGLRVVGGVHLAAGAADAAGRAGGRDRSCAHQRVLDDGRYKPCVTETLRALHTQGAAAARQVPCSTRYPT